MEKKNAGKATAKKSTQVKQSSDNATCCSCNADFKNEMNELVDNVEGYTKTDHNKKEQELREAFGEK